MKDFRGWHVWDVPPAASLAGIWRDRLVGRYIITNNHVVADAVDVEIILADRRQFKGRVVATDPKPMWPSSNQCQRGFPPRPGVIPVHSLSVILFSRSETRSA